MKAYIASSWFNPVADLEVNNIIESLKSNNFDFFSPRDFFVCPPTADLNTQKSTYEGNLEHLELCDFMVCNTHGKDMGSIFEAGYFNKLNKPIVYFCATLPAGAPFNLMLAQSGVKVCTSFEELSDYLSRCQESKKLLFEPYYGTIE
jgi:nucleoside 2-deoxyribosyltransferase|tara:strand:+ start:2376 stop:2816 length:441 start_codon:yes stop_codon:yes gene_type:complete